MSGIFFCLKEDQVFKPERICFKPIPKYWSSTPPPPPHLGITMDEERSLTNNDETV